MLPAPGELPCLVTLEVRPQRPTYSDANLRDGPLSRGNLTSKWSAMHERRVEGGVHLAVGIASPELPTCLMPQ
jgi:hypothetical protein